MVGILKSDGNGKDKTLVGRPSKRTRSKGALGSRDSRGAAGPESRWLDGPFEDKHQMKRSPLLLFISLGFVTVALHKADAGSAVALAAHNQLATAYGGSIQREEQRALADALRRYGPPVRVLAATDVTGYGAIAVARHPNGNWVIGVSLGKRSATEAYTLAVDHCLKAGGTHPEVKWAFRG